MSGLDPIERSSSSPASAGISPGDVGLAGPVLEAHAGGDSGRLESRVAPLRGRLSAPIESLVGGVEVAWSPLHVGESWPAYSWEDLVAGTVRTTSGTGGEFSFDQEPPVAEAGVSLVWTSDPRSRCAVLPIGDGEKEPHIDLVQATPISIRVIDGSGNQVAGASIRWTARVPLDEPSDGARAVVYGESRTGADGIARLARVGGELVIQASSGGSTTIPWQGDGEAAKEIVLELRRVVDAEGSVSGLDGVAVRDLGVTAFLMQGEKRATLAHRSVRADGQWKIDGLPFVAEGEYGFRLTGIGLVPQERFVVLSSPAKIQVDFEAEQAATGQIRVEDNDDQPVPFAQVEMRWRAGERWCRSDHRADEHGMVALTDAPSADVWFFVRAPGYVPREIGAFLSPRDFTEDASLVIGRAGRIRGRCLHDESPVRSFTVTYWREPSTIGFSQKEFRDSEDGSFSIDDAPVGPVFLYATSAEFPKGDTFSVETTSSEVAFVELRMPSPGEVRGRVVDSMTRQPIPDTVLEVFASDGDQLLARWNEPITVDPSGAFEGIPVSPCWNKLRIHAPGYETRTYSGRPDEHGVWDCHAIALRRQQALKLRLDAPGVDAPGGFIAEVRNEQGLPRVQFDSEGRAEIEGVDPGHAEVLVFTPDMKQRQQMGVDLEPGTDWEIVASFDPSRRLSIRIVPEDGSALPETIWLLACYLSNGDVPTSRALGMDDDGSAVIDGIEGNSVTVEVWDSHYRTIGARRFDVDPAGLTEVSIPLGLPARTIRFVDLDGAPLAATRVIFSLPAGDTGWGFATTTDERGECELTGIDTKELYAEVRLADGSQAVGLPVRTDGSPEDIVEIIVDSHASLRMRLLDRDVPLVETRVFLSYWEQGLPDISRQTDEEGWIVDDSISPSFLTARVDVAGYWPARTTVEVSHEPRETIMQVRRTGDLEIFVHRSGVSMPGAGIELVSDEFGESVSTWVSAEQVRADAPTLVTDALGTSRLYGLPNGGYAWRVSCPGQGSREGTVSVPPHGMERLVIDL